MIHECGKASRLPVAGGLQHDRAHRVRHALHDDRYLDAAADDVADDVVDGQAVGDVAAGAVDVEVDRPVVVVGELAQPLDAEARGVFLDVADQVDVALPVALLLAELRADGIDELGDQAIAQFTHRRYYRIAASAPDSCELGGLDCRPQSPNCFQIFCPRRPAADRRTRRGCGRATRRS